MYPNGLMTMSRMLSSLIGDILTGKILLVEIVTFTAPLDPARDSKM